MLVQVFTSKLDYIVKLKPKTCGKLGWKMNSFRGEGLINQMTVDKLIVTARVTMTARQHVKFVK